MKASPTNVGEIHESQPGFPPPMRILRRDDVQDLLPPGEAIPLMREAFGALVKGRISMPPRVFTQADRHRGSIAFMPAFVEAMDAMGMKAVALYLDNPSKRGLPAVLGSMLLFDAKTGETLALIDAGPLTSARTAGVSALATGLLSREDAAVAGFIGTGVQARGHAMALPKVRPIQRILAYDVVPEACEVFVEWVGDDLGLEAEAVSSAQALVGRSDVVTTATTATSPFLRGAWIPEGCHLNVIGSGPAHEVDEVAYQRADKVVVDMWEHSITEARDIMAYVEGGTLTREMVHGDLGELVVGERPGREAPREITLFRSIGLAIEDVAAAKYVYDQALRQDRGVEVEFP